MAKCEICEQQNQPQALRLQPADKGKITLIIGPRRSGKTSKAIGLAQARGESQDQLHALELVEPGLLRGRGLVGREGDDGIRHDGLP